MRKAIVILIVVLAMLFAPSAWALSVPSQAAAVPPQPAAAGGGYGTQMYYIIGGVVLGLLLMYNTNASKD